MPEHHKIIQATRNWVVDVVVGLNFCPFAKREVENQTLRYRVTDADTASAGLDALLKELHLLEADPSIETALLIFSKGFSDFNDYLDLLEKANSLLDWSGYQGIVQLASFHPDYCFEGEDAKAPANYTNRSPYPMLHLLREASLDRVLKVYKDPDQIPTRNIAIANQLGEQALSQLLAACRQK